MHTLAEDEEELNQLFSIFDTDGAGVVEVSTMQRYLARLDMSGIGSIPESMRDIPGSSRSRGLSREEFVAFMRSNKLSMVEAVGREIDEGLQRYAMVTNHDEEPVSLLINRDAFLVRYSEHSVMAQCYCAKSKPLT